MTNTRVLMDATYEAIKSIEEKQAELRDNCNHEEILVDYSWRIGSIEKAYVCKHCDKFIEFKAQREGLYILKSTP